MNHIEFLECAKINQTPFTLHLKIVNQIFQGNILESVKVAESPVAEFTLDNCLCFECEETGYLKICHAATTLHVTRLKISDIKTITDENEAAIVSVQMNRRVYI